MSIKLKRINDVKVKKVRTSLDDDKRPVKGESLFPEIYSNIFLCARKMSGKSTVLFKIIKETCTPQTTVIAFASTLHKDDVWKEIVKMCKNRKIPFVGHTSIFEDGADQLQTLVQFLEEEASDQNDKDNEESSDSEDEIIQCDNSSDEEEKPRKPRKSKYKAPEYLIILDDLSSELKSKSLVALLKKNRHYKTKICISSQYLNDLLPESRKQLDYMLVFKGQSKKKLEEIHRDCDIGIDLEDFMPIYHVATENPHSFLYVDTRKNLFRKNFNIQISV